MIRVMRNIILPVLMIVLCFYLASEGAASAAGVVGVTAGAAL